MGRLIKNHWARLIVLTAAACKAIHTHDPHDPGRHTNMLRNPVQIGSAIEGFIWPKLLWDFMTKNLNGAVKPVPILQILNLVMGLVGLAWEWPLNWIAGTFPHRSIEIRLVIYPLSALLAVLLYQGTHPALYYLVGMGVYFWAYTEGEVCASPTGVVLNAESLV